MYFFNDRYITNSVGGTHFTKREPGASEGGTYYAEVFDNVYVLNVIYPGV